MDRMNIDWFAFAFGSIGLVCLAIAVLLPDTEGFSWWLRKVGLRSEPDPPSADDS